MDQLYELICVHSFGDIKKGDHITDPAEVDKHLDDREHHFIRIPKSAPEPVAVAPKPVPVPVPTK